jgi:hypothetical protein
MNLLETLTISQNHFTFSNIRDFLNLNDVYVLFISIK